MKLLKTIVLAIAAAFIIQGCSEKGVSMEEIPATADYVAVINADSIPDAISTLLIPAETPAQTGSLAESCDLSHILFYKPADSRQPFAAATVKDEKKLTSFLTELGWQKRKTEGVTAYSNEEWGEFAPCVIVENDAAWFLGTRGDIKNWKESLRQAEKENFGKYGLDFSIDGNKRLKAYVRPAFFGIADDMSMLQVTAAAGGDNTLTVKAGFISVADGKTGEPIPFTALSAINDTRFSRYLPAGQNSFVFAAGLTDKINWTGLVEMFGAGLGTRNHGMLQTLLPYMTSLKGPFAIGVGPLTAESLTSDDIESQSIIVYATLDGGKASDAVNEINGNLREKGLNPQPRADGVYAFDLNGVRYRYTATPDGVFLFALNRELDSPQPADPALFAGRQAFAELRLPPLSAILPGVKDNLSITATMTVGSDGLTLVTHSGKVSPLIAFSRYFAAIEAARQSREEESADYYDEL